MTVHRLQQEVGKLRTRVGGAFVGSRAVFRGQDLHHDLRDIGWFGLRALGITGRRFRPEQLRLLEWLYVSTSYPDARIWNNRVAALAGTVRSTPNLALTGALAVSESVIYGRRNEFKAVSLFRRVHREMQNGATLADCIQRHLQTRGTLPGYGRPLASADERIAPAMQLARELGLADGPYVTLAFDIERYLKEQGKPLQMNFGALVSAFGADIGFTPREHNLYAYPCFIGGMEPCYLEAVDKPPGHVMPTPCSGVRYEGAAPRTWPSEPA